MTDEAVVLMKISMGRIPPVDVVVPFSVLPEACLHFEKKNEAISFVVGSAVKSEAVDPANAIFISDIDDGKDYLSLLLVIWN